MLFLTFLVTATAVSAQFALSIVKPLHGEFLFLGATVPVEIQVNVPPGTQGPNIQLSLCREITGINLCDGTMETILLNAPFNPPDQTYNVTIPEDQIGGLTKLIAGHITEVDGVPVLSDNTTIPVFLGSPP